MIAIAEFPIKETLAQRQRQFLVHSYMYYVLDDSIISDTKYDRICKDMVRLMEAYPLEAKESPYYDICIECGTAGSGFYIEKYPPQIITTALRLLYNKKDRLESFPQFVGRWGFHIL